MNPFEMETFPDTLNGPVNLRPIIQDVKLNCNGDKNLYEAFVVNKEPAYSPMTGPMIATVSSYSVATQEEGSDSLLLHSVKRNQYELQLVVTTLTKQDIENALRWLDGVEYESHTVANVPSGMTEYFQALGRVNINCVPSFYLPQIYECRI